MNKEFMTPKITKAFLNFKFLLVFCYFILADISYALPPLHRGSCSSSVSWKVVCDSSDYNVCTSSSSAKLTQFNNLVLSLKEEQRTIAPSINSCLEELLSFSKIETDKKSEFAQSVTRIEELKNTKIQIENLQRTQESFLLSLDVKINELGWALPEIALRLENLFEKQNTNINLIISDLRAQALFAKTAEEIEIINLNINIFNNLKITQSRVTADVPKAFNDLLKNALYGEGDSKLKAINSFDPLTYLILKTVLGDGSTGDIDIKELKNQIQLIRNDMNNLTHKQENKIAREEQEIIQYSSDYYEASTNRLNKEIKCKKLKERNELLPKLIKEAEIGASESNSLLAGCNRFCSKKRERQSCTSDSI